MRVPLKISDPKVKSKRTIRASLPNDLDILSEAAHQGSLVNIELPAASQLVQKLKKAVEKQPKHHGDCCHVRQIVSILRSYNDSVPYAAAELAILNQGLDELTQMIGGIPTIPPGKLQWMSPEFLPDDFEGEAAVWKSLPCPEPTTGRGGGEIHFVVDPDSGKSSIRSAMQKKAESDGMSVIDVTDDKPLFLNLMDFVYYEWQLLHADHLAPAQELIRRQQEIIEAMNRNPRLKAEIMQHPEAGDFFLDDPRQPGCIVGSYWYYMAVYNDQRNLWLLLASENSCRKGAKNPIDWLNSFKLGQDFLREHGRDICKDDLFYSFHDKTTTLKDAFVQWVVKNKKEHILAAQACGEGYQQMMEAIRASKDLKKLAFFTVKMRVDNVLRSRHGARGRAGPAAGGVGESASGWGGVGGGLSGAVSWVADAGWGMVDRLGRAVGWSAGDGASSSGGSSPDLTHVANDSEYIDRLATRLEDDPDHAFHEQAKESIVRRHAKRLAKEMSEEARADPAATAVSSGPGRIPSVAAPADGSVAKRLKPDGGGK